MHSLSLFHSHGGGTHTLIEPLQAIFVLFAKNCNSRAHSHQKNCHTHVWMPCCCVYTIVTRHSIFLRQFVLFTRFFFLSSGGIEEIVCKLHFHGCVGSELNKATATTTTIKSAELKLELFRRERINAKLYSQILQLNENSQDEKKHIQIVCVCIFVDVNRCHKFSFGFS